MVDRHYQAESLKSSSVASLSVFGIISCSKPVLRVLNILCRSDFKLSLFASQSNSVEQNNKMRKQWERKSLKNAKFCAHKNSPSIA